MSVEENNAITRRIIDEVWHNRVENEEIVERLADMSRIAYRRPMQGVTAMADGGTTLVRRFIEEMINGNNLALADELFAPGYVDHTPGAPPVPPGPAGMRDTVTIFRTAFPNDMHYTIQDLFGAGDRVAVRWTARGTNTGSLMGSAPTGKAVAVSAVYIFRVADGKLAEAWGDFDALGMQQQLGLLPAPGNPA